MADKIRNGVRTRVADSKQTAPLGPDGRSGDADNHAATPIVVAATKVISANPHFNGRRLHLHFEVQGDLLVVHGQAPSYYMKQLVQSTLKGLAGVRTIDNRIRVKRGSA